MTFGQLGPFAGGSSSAPPASGVQSSSNVGGGAQLALARVADDLPFRTLSGLGDVAIATVGNLVQVDGSALYPCDGSRPLTGNLDCDTWDIVKPGNIVTSNAVQKIQFPATSINGSLDMYSLADNEVMLGLRFTPTESELYSYNSTFYLTYGARRIRLPLVAPLAGQVLSTDALGNTVWVTPATPAVGGQSAQTYPIATSTGYTSVNGGTVVLFASMVVPTADVTITEMATIIGQANPGNITFAVYQGLVNPVLVGTTTSVAVSTTGVIVAPLLSPVNLIGGNIYYFALMSSSNGTTTATRNDATTAGNISLNCNVPGVTYNVWPANLNTSTRTTNIRYIVGGS